MVFPFGIHETTACLHHVYKFGMAKIHLFPLLTQKTTYTYLGLHNQV